MSDVKTLFIGLDGATFTVLDSLVRPADADDNAIMPFLSGIYRNGARSVLVSTPNPLTPPAWMSLMTGRTPGNHGVFDFIRAEERGSDVFFTLYDARDCRTETIWSMASRHGRKIAALNFPFTAPPAGNINGILVPGFVPWRHLRINTHPREFYDRLKQLPGFDPKQLAWDFELEKNAVSELSDREKEEWIRYHLPREQQWFDMALHVVETESPDLMAVMFDGVDKLQHQAWRFLAPEFRSGLKDGYARRMRELCLEYFRQLDSFIERLWMASGENTRLFLASDHGFTTTREVVRINVFLEQKGYLRWKDMPDTDEARRREDSMFANLDWNYTTAYCRTPSSNGITIRVAGDRCESGISPDEYDDFRERLVADLEELRDEESGERIIRHIYRREEVFPGPAMTDAPDLLLVLRDYGFVSIKNREPVVEKRPEVAGTHHPDGIFMAFGPGIRKGVMTGRHNIVDVTSALLYSLGLPLPDSLEGEMPESMFEEDFLRCNPPCLERTGNVPEAVNGGAEDVDDMMEAEKDRLMDQLKMLGYME